MASDLVDGDYLGSYRKFIVDFLYKVNPDDQLPIKTSGHDVTEGEMVGEIIHMTLQYLNQQLCPPTLQCHIVQRVILEIKATCRKQPESCGYKQEEKTYAPLKLMQAVASKVNEICRRYLENSRLALLPPPPSTPMPLANAFAIRNHRRKMEDRHVILHDLNTIFNIKDDSIASYYAVFDGHAGYQAAVFCAAHLHQYLAENRHYPTDPERALQEAFLTADNVFVQKSTRQTLSSGTTAVCALILNRKLYVAWAGDSQAALAKRGVVTQLVNPHKPDRNDERERVEEMGGTVLHLGIWRVNGNLAVSRAIGDAQYKPYVTGEPEIRCITLDGDEDFLIIGCDGLWDCVSENEAAALVYRDLYMDPRSYEFSSQRLVEYAKLRGSIDNITVIVVFLATPNKIAARSAHYGNPPLADVQLLMEPVNRFLSNANGQYDVNAAFVKPTAANNGSSDPMDDEDPYGSYANKSSNGKHRENGDSAVQPADYDAEEDDEDLGPETDVDALDDVSETLPTLADVSRELFPEKQDPCEIYQSEERMDDETPPSPQATKTNQQALIPEADNVGDSEDSEDEWNYYRIDPNKEKESAGAAGFSPVPKPDNETREDIVGAASSPNEQHGDEKNDSDSSSEPDSEREIRSIAHIDTEISAPTNFELIPSPKPEEKVDEEEKERFEPEKEAVEFKSEKESVDFELEKEVVELEPGKQTEHFEYEKQTEYFEPEKQTEHFEFEKQTEHFEPEKQTEQFEFEKQTEHFEPEKQIEHFESEKESEHFELEKQTEHFEPEKQPEHFEPENQTEHFEAEEQREHFEAEKQTEHFELEKQTDHFKPENQAEHFELEKEPEKIESEKETENFEFEKETESIEPEKKPENLDLYDQQYDKNYAEEDMDFQLNPDAAEFVPVSPTPIIPTRMDLDAPIAGSPLKQTPAMDDITIPSRREFENEVRNRPCEIEEKSSCTNGQLLADLDDCVQKPAPLFNLDESEVSSTKAEFGDDTSFLTASEFHRTGVSNLDGSYTDSLGAFDDSGVDPMTKSFGPDDFMDLGNPVDLNAVHDLPDDIDDNCVPADAEEEEKMNLENIQASAETAESAESQYNENPTVDPTSTNETLNILDSSSPLLSPSSPIPAVHFSSEITETRVDSPVSAMLEAEKVAKEDEKSPEEPEIVSAISQPFYDDTSVTSKLLEMDLEDRGSQDCGFEKCNEKFAAEEENSARSDVADLMSSPVPRGDSVASTVSESLPVESPLVEEIDKLAENLGELNAHENLFTAAPEVPVLQNPLQLQFENGPASDADICFEDIPDYKVTTAPDYSVDIISPLMQDASKNNPFETADFGSPVSFGDPQETQPKFHDSEEKNEKFEPEIVEIRSEVETPAEVVEAQPEIKETQPEVPETLEIPTEIPAVTSTMKLSESLQEFTGLEEQLNPENTVAVSNGLQENLPEIQSETKVEQPEARESLVDEPKEDSAKLEAEKKPEVPLVSEPAKPEKEEIVVAAVAVAATAAAAGSVVAAATKSTKPKPTSKTALKSSAATKAPGNKSTPTSPTKPALATRTSSLAASKKPATTTSAARPTKLDTGKPAASKTAATTGKTATSAPKARLSVASPRTKPATSTISKTSTTAADKKPTTNGDATKSSLTSKATSTAAKITAKPLVKTSTTRATSATTTTTTTAPRATRTSAVGATSTLNKVAGKTATGTVGTTTQRPKTAPSGGASTLATKSRLAASTKSPITEKQIKETANKQISSSRTSTTTTASRTSRTSVSSSTTTTTRRTAAAKTTSTASSAATQAIPPPIRKPAPITRPGGKTAALPAAAAGAAPTTNGKSHVTKTTTNKTKVVVQNGVCTAETKIVTSTTNIEDEDVPKKDLSPVEPTTDNQLIVAAD